jgi:glycosylphosphatidylinositol deacylase
MCLILMLIFLFVPWQVAFLGCWAIHLDTCATPRLKQTLIERDAAIPLIRGLRRESNNKPSVQPEAPATSPSESHSPTDGPSFNLNSHHRNMHILLLMTWLLPLVAPVLAVWVRTLITAGFTVPFGGDHNFLNIVPFLLLVDARSSGRMPETRS